MVWSEGAKNVFQATIWVSRGELVIE
uniref:Uncharacterized protein n=1 Tax=Anguilla anguilla TaxID=7936 RepID=A0A0E9PQF0_ANGAN